jgi:hypothetical protein
VRKTGKRWPVAIWRCQARRATNQAMTIATTSATGISQAPSPQIGRGMKKPRPLRKVPNGNS